MSAGDYFRVALSGDFFRDDGSPVFPEFELTPLRQHPRVEVVVLEQRGSEIHADQVADMDALILLVPTITANGFDPARRLGLIARFGVGYDSVDVPACTANEVGLEEVFRRSDLLSVNCPLAEATRHMVNAELADSAAWQSRLEGYRARFG